MLILLDSQPLKTHSNLTNYPGKKSDFKNAFQKSDFGILV